MPDFVSDIEVNGEKRYFAFRKTLTPAGLKLFVTTLTATSDTIKFEMKHDGYSWIIMPPAPDWIVKMERQLSDIIMAHTLLNEKPL